MAPLAPLVPPPMSIRTLMIAKAMPTPPTAYTNSCVMLLRPVGESVVVVVAVVASVVVVVGSSSSWGRSSNEAFTALNNNSISSKSMRAKIFVEGLHDHENENYCQTMY